MDLPLIFVVIEDNEIIAEDVAESIKEYVASAVVHIWRSTEVSMEAFRSLPNLSAAFLSMTDNEVTASGLDKAVQLRGGAMVLLYGRDFSAPGEPTGWQYVERPFTTCQIHSVLRRLGIAKTDRAQ